MTASADIQEMDSLCSRLKTLALKMRSMRELHLAARYMRAAAELENNVVEKRCLEVGAAFTELAFLERSRPDLSVSIQNARKKLLEDVP